ncbi:DUF3857 and transglutaminase domain-containing protein [Mucilaginibacter daejeonensis]|uniref:DUF3857 domain-containing protein n=1 Tax=Mucilaginibacter daejeonensis TaxID=398049 RepID=UPI001D174E77|nr:DUF3857 domain-containing protein [Mucilaginibacter daejeonensis]UEG54734.1 DUF3857 and transglutaminase domain-containing protein [Mucilaginibacter daejeonensis]
MPRALIALLSLLCVINTAKAADFPFGNFTVDELAMKSYAKDATAHAVVLQEYGKSWISSVDGLPLIHEYHVKIKLIDSKALNEGNVHIPVYRFDNNRVERIRDVEGITTYTDENGNVQRITFDPRQVITENHNKYWDEVKFAMPGLRPGCIIEYKYTLESPNTLGMKDWTFQSSMPKMRSEYEVRIPAFFNYKATLRGPYKLTENKADIDRDCFEARGAKCDCSKLVFVMADIPAFVEEQYMTAPKNFISAIDFELNDFTDPFSGIKHIKTQTWDDIDRALKQHEDFGGQMRKTSLFKDRVAAMTAGKTTDLDKARSIYNYIQKELKFNNFTGIYTDNGIRRTLEGHTGSVADVNLSLIAALNAAGIPTEAVLLSTRDHGFINKLYPVVSDFNYVIAKANVGGTSYMLDATDPLLPFGLLPVKCMNDQGRVVSLNKPSYWVDMVASQKRNRMYMMDLKLNDNGKLTGTISNFSSGYEALDKRRAIKKFNSIDEYVEDLDNKMPKIKILNAKITNLDSLDRVLAEVYEVEINVYDNLKADRLSFDPYLFNQITDNPFKLADRTYPVDLGAASDVRITLNMTLPPNYTIEDAPKNLLLGLPANGGRFLTEYEATPNGFTFSHIIELKKPIYSTEEYPYLKELYNKIIQAQKAGIVFKKRS